LGRDSLGLNLARLCLDLGFWELVIGELMRPGFGGGLMHTALAGAPAAGHQPIVYSLFMTKIVGK
jgi:hypothetical protein